MGQYSKPCQEKPGFFRIAKNNQGDESEPEGDICSTREGESKCKQMQDKHNATDDFATRFFRGAQVVKRENRCDKQEHRKDIRVLERRLLRV